MAVETTTYDVTCQHCGEETSFRINDVDELSDDIDQEKDDLADSTRCEVHAEYEGFIDPGDANWRHFLEIGAALRRKDIAAATEHVRALANDLGVDLQEQLDRGLITTVPLFERVT